jgi:predicted CopG family antitoxin
MKTVNMTISLPKELYERMKEYDEISWSAALRKMIEKKLADLELLDALTSKSRLTNDDAARLAEKIDARVAKKLGLS